MRGTRRRFLRVGATAALGASAWSGLFTRRTRADLGPLQTDPDGILDLPQGFGYRVLERAGDPMDDGYSVPGRPDGMACFDGPDGTWVLMRNHELDRGFEAHAAWGPLGSAPPEAYDANAHGGVTRVVIDARSHARLSSNLVLTGTLRNCAGGPSPWGWLSCEENTEAGHGYVFLCSTDAARVQPPRFIPGYGRFNHEAVAIDDRTLIAYLTEDRPDSCLYRFVPDGSGFAHVGNLQALKIVGEDGFETAAGRSVGETWQVEWVDIDEPAPLADTVRSEAQGKGAAVFARGEGIWFHQGRVLVCATTGGPVAGGQIFELTTDDTLTLLAQSEDREALDMPDNITVGPGGLLFMAEDGERENYLRVLDGSGQVRDFARNALSDSELAGVCFSPDGEAMFVNLQEDGLTLLVSGPWHDLGGMPLGGASADDEPWEGTYDGGLQGPHGGTAADGGVDAGVDDGVVTGGVGAAAGAGGGVPGEAEVETGAPGAGCDCNAAPGSAGGAGVAAVAAGALGLLSRRSRSRGDG